MGRVLFGIFFVLACAVSTADEPLTLGHDALVPFQPVQAGSPTQESYENDLDNRNILLQLRHVKEMERESRAKMETTMKELEYSYTLGPGGIAQFKKGKAKAEAYQFRVEETLKRAIQKLVEQDPSYVKELELREAFDVMDIRFRYLSDKLNSLKVGQTLPTDQVAELIKVKQGWEEALEKLTQFRIQKAVANKDKETKLVANRERLAIEIQHLRSHLRGGQVLNEAGEKTNVFGWTPIRDAIKKTLEEYGTAIQRSSASPGLGGRTRGGARRPPGGSL